jgi:8-oxo-dGTP diphosphatase
VVTHRRFVTREDLSRLRYKPDSLPDAAWGTPGTAPILYDALEVIVR